jgi:hypothetical protein
MNFLDSATANQTDGLWFGQSDCFARVFADDLTHCTMRFVKLGSQEEGGNSIAWIVFCKSDLQRRYCLWNPCDYSQ